MILSKIKWLLADRRRQRIVTVSYIVIFIILINVIAYVFRPPKYLFQYDIVKSLPSPKVDISFFEGKGIKIGIGCAITTRGIFNDQDIDSKKSQIIHEKARQTLILKLPIFEDLLPSFCRTASNSFMYKFFVGYDFNDPFLGSDHGHKDFQLAFKTLIQSTCSYDLHISLQLVKCDHTHQPARAQNDAMMAAYTDNMDYLYRVNDDTRMITPGWTEAFIQTLQGLNPPYIGVVGPSTTAKISDNTYILTYEFVHRTHVDIFGFYYPHMLTTWYADDWITHVYQPGRSVRLSDVLLEHTQKLGQRYQDGDNVLSELSELIMQGKEAVRTWVDRQQNTTHRIFTDFREVI